MDANNSAPDLDQAAGGSMMAPPRPDPQDLPGPRRLLGRAWVFGVVAGLCVLLAVGYVARAGLHAPVPAPPTAAGAPIGAGGAVVMFQNLADDAQQGVLGLVPLGDPDGPRNLTDLHCDRVHFGGGRGLCLAADTSVATTEHALVFGSDLRVQHDIPLGGLPSRARVSPDGRYGSTTVFVTGHSYTEQAFSTKTTLIDMTAGTQLTDLEQFAVIRDGADFRAQDFNFWGVTFSSDSNVFYATLATGGRTYLVRGDVTARRMTVLRDNVECPSLSPDGTRLAFKKRVDNGATNPVWRFHVLDLAAMQETPLAESRSIDDQIEWLDNSTVLYGSPDSTRSVFALPADGTGEPHRYLSNALSPAVVHGQQLTTPAAAAAAGEAAPAAAPVDLGVVVNAPAQGVVAVPSVQTVQVTNTSSRNASRIVLEDVVSGEVRITGATATTPPGATGYGCAVLAPENRVRCDTSALPSGATWTVTVTVFPLAPGTVGGQAMVTAAEPDSGSANDSASAETSVHGG